MNTQLADRRVTRPYENTRKRMSAGGMFPWSVTVTQGDSVVIETFWDRGEADALHARAVAAGFVVV